LKRICRLSAFVAEAFDRQLNFSRAVSRWQRMTVYGLEVFKANHPRAAQAFKMRMLPGMFLCVREKTPGPVLTHHFMHKAFLVQPVKHAVERDTIQAVFMA
jgi:hypothetical protein